MEHATLMDKFLECFHFGDTAFGLRLGFKAADVDSLAVERVMEMLLARPQPLFNRPRFSEYTLEPYTTMDGVVGIVIKTKPDSDGFVKEAQRILFVPLNDVTSYRHKNDGEEIYTIERDAKLVYCDELDAVSEAAKNLTTELIDRIKNK
jgi:hypothetical protein